ncbi:keratin, type I cytoskeletal 9-like, partial [Temnothorax curvispinosus]|uniref:Keratin, type I cytoskeletal 9-like n=1 Tax=Temnothorax curvispinosus TaxID=300111 RepID=A0A6J1PTT7_9HYME
MTVRLDNAPDMSPKLPEGLKGIGMELEPGDNILLDIPNVQANNSPGGPNNAFGGSSFGGGSGNGGGSGDNRLLGAAARNIPNVQANNSPGNNAFGGSSFGGGRDFDGAFSRDGDRVSGGSGSGGDNKFGNTYGLSTQFLESLGINGPLLYDRDMTVRLDNAPDMSPKLPEGLKGIGMELEPGDNILLDIPNVQANNSPGGPNNAFGGSSFGGGSGNGGGSGDNRLLGAAARNIPNVQANNSPGNNAFGGSSFGGGRDFDGAFSRDGDRVSGGSGSGGDNKFGNTYGLSTQFLESL